MKKIKTALSQSVARIIAALTVLRDRIAAFAGAVKDTKDAADKALVQIDKGIRALEEAKAKAEAAASKAQTKMDAFWAAHYEAYDALAEERSRAQKAISRAGALIEKYTA